MPLSLEHSIYPISELRSNPKKIKKRLKASPVVITVDGRPDFGVCDLETLEMARQIKALKDLLKARIKSKSKRIPVEEAFRRLDKKYGF